MFGIVTRIDWTIQGLNKRKEIFLISRMSTSALGPTQPPIQCILGFLARGKAVRE